jgi:hypothetical protein
MRMESVALRQSRTVRTGGELNLVEPRWYNRLNRIAVED